MKINIIESIHIISAKGTTLSDNKSKIRAFIIENFLFGNDDGLQDETSFLEDGIIDSTGVLELVNFLE